MSNTPYDDIFRTMCIDLPRFMIPMNNLSFNEETRLDAEVTVLGEHIFISDDKGGQEKRIVDSVYSINGKRYHWECESNPDNTILLRLWEYDSQLAGLNYSLDAKQGTLTVDFPKTALLYLRSGQSTPDTMKIIIRTDGGNVNYDIPIIKIRDYSLEKIFEKRLYFLIPFYAFRYEPWFRKMDKNKELLEIMKNELKQTAELLQKHTKLGFISEYKKKTILTLAGKCIESLTEKHKELNKEVHEFMGGEVLEYEAKTILRQGRDQKEAEIIRRLISQKKSHKEICELLGVTEETITKVVSKKE